MDSTDFLKNLRSALNQVLGPDKFITESKNQFERAVDSAWQGGL